MLDLLENLETAANEMVLDFAYHPRQTQALEILETPITCKACGAEFYFRPEDDCPKCRNAGSVDGNGDLVSPFDFEELVLGFGGAKGGGKTLHGCQWVVQDAAELIQRCGLRPSDKHLAIGFLGRNRAKDFRDTTLEEFKQEIPSRIYQIKQDSHELVLFDTVKYMCGGFDNREDIEKFNSAQYCRFWVDQAEEISEQDFALLRATLRLKIKVTDDSGRIKTYIPKYRGFLTCNPAQNWVKRDFVKNPQGKGGNYFVQSLPEDNPWLPPSYIQTLKKSFAHRPELLAAYMKGNWDVVAGTDQIILDSWVEASHAKKFIGDVKRKLVVADIARFGDDKIVIQYQEETDIIDKEVYGHRDATWTAGKIAEMARRHLLADEKPPTIVVDADNMGGPIADFLRGWGFEVYDIHSAKASSDPERFYNLRAEMWWTAGEAFSRGEIFLTERESDATLYRELTVPRYSFRDGRILVESKDEIKKPDRYGQSPDEADTYIYGLYGRKFARLPQIKKKDHFRERHASPMAV